MSSFVDLLRYLFVFCVAVQAVTAAPKMVVYWGQSSAAEGSLRSYCQDSTYDIIVLAFIDYFPTSPGSSLPGMNLAGHCNDALSGAPNLLNCPTVGSDITFCQSRGKQVLISLGGATGNYGFTSDSQAQAFATTMWNVFFGGSGQPRPFGNAVLDGVDLDIESGKSTGYSAFVTALRSKFVGASKPYYISAAPQCPYPDDWLGPKSGTAFSQSWFDYIWVQFYNNNCGLNYYPSKFNYNTWANWATGTSINPNVKIFIGAPASADAAGEGYVTATKLIQISTSVATQYPNIFGGVMLWDAGTAAKNANFGAVVGSGIKAAVGNGGGASPVSPNINVPAVTTKKATTHAPAPTVATTHKAATTGRAQSTTKPSTTGRAASAPSTVPSAPSTVPSAPSGGANPAPSGSCTNGHMVCTTSETYKTCDRGVWGGEQHCQQGLTCSPSGVYIYCI